MIETLITSKTRIKLLLKFFLNPSSKAYLRSLETEFGDSTNGIRLELNRFEKAGMLKSFVEGNKKMFRANTQHPLFMDIQSIVFKYVGVDHIIETVIKRLGDLEEVYLTGEYAQGRDNEIIDLIFVGDIDKAYLMNLIVKAELLIKRKIRFLIYHPKEFDESNIKEEILLIWNQS